MMVLFGFIGGFTGALCAVLFVLKNALQISEQQHEVVQHEVHQAEHEDEVVAYDTYLMNSKFLRRWWLGQEQQGGETQ